MNELSIATLIPPQNIVGESAPAASTACAATMRPTDHLRVFPLTTETPSSILLRKNP